MTQRINSMNTLPAMIGFAGVSSGGRTSHPLNAAYVHKTSGPAVAVRYMARTAGAITELYVFLGAINGTLGNITMEALIYNEGGAGVGYVPGSTLRATSSATVMPDGANKWIKFTFGTPYTPAVGEVLWLIVRNTASAPTTDYPSILIDTTTIPNFPTLPVCNPYRTTAGFSGNGTLSAEMPFVINQDGVYFGQPFTQNVTTPYTNGTLARGMEFSPAEDVEVIGFVGSEGSGSTGWADLKIFDGATGPGGTALHTFSLDADANQLAADIIGGKLFSAPVFLRGGQTYRVVLTVTGATQVPYAAQIEDYSSYSSIFDALRGQSPAHQPWGVIDDGAGGWTQLKNILPGMALLVGRYPVHPKRSPSMNGGLS